MQFLSITFHQTCFFIELFGILGHLKIVHYILDLVLGYSEIPSSCSLLGYLKRSPLRVLNLHQVCVGINKLSICVFLCILSLLNISHFYKSLLSLLLIEYYNSQNISKFVEYGEQDFCIDRELDFGDSNQKDWRGRLRLFNSICTDLVSVGR
jgi:hypothetical protein